MLRAEYRNYPIPGGLLVAAYQLFTGENGNRELGNIEVSHLVRIKAVGDGLFLK